MAAIPDPEIGLVVHFNYPWKREHDQGRDNARYPRPCAVVLAQRRLPDGAVSVIVAPPGGSRLDHGGGRSAERSAAGA